MTPSVPRLFRGGRIYLWMLAAALLISAVSLKWPATPSYDPWSWLLWGRQILHGHLSLKSNGSSWKPMPVVFTTVLALFGSAAPNLWLLLARAGFLLTLMMTFRYAWRIVLGLRGPWPGAAGSRPVAGAQASALNAAVRYAPAALAGLIAVVGIGLTHGFPGNSLLGYSESLATAATMIAVERALDGHHRQAFALGLFAALDRPESWAVWGLYGLWLIWKRPDTRRLVVGLVVMAIALWVIPQKLGGQSAVGLASTNRSSTSAANSSFPLWTELHTVEWSLVLTRVKLVGILTLIISCASVARRWWRTRTLRPSSAYEQSVLWIVALGLFGFAWWLGIAIETQAGFAGNPRYAVFGSIPEYIVGGVGYAWAALALARHGGSLLARVRLRLSWQLRLGGATALLAVIFVVIPGSVTSSLLPVSALRNLLRYQGRIREEMVALIAANGGPQALLDCGPIVTESHQIPMLAWYLNTTTSGIDASIYASPTVPMNVIFQVSAVTGGPLEPGDDVIGQWEALGRNYEITLTDPVNFYKDCRK